MVWLPMFGVFNARTDADACHCTRGLYEHRKTVCTGCWLWEKNPLPHRGLEPASVLRVAFQSDAPIEHFLPYMTIWLSCCSGLYHPYMTIWQSCCSGLYHPYMTIWQSCCSGLYLRYMTIWLSCCTGLWQHWATPISTPLTAQVLIPCIVLSQQDARHRIVFNQYSNLPLASFFMHLSTRTVHSCHSAPSWS